jgi:hypothetical protein
MADRRKLDPAMARHNMSELMDAALTYAARGWPVFPCKPGQKVPATVHGVLDATTDTNQIRRWWKAAPAANVAIATGDPGPDVIDVDVKPDGNGYKAFGELREAGLASDPGWYVTTPSGGLHAYYTGTGQRNGTIRGRYIDFRGQGGYVVAPPSVVDDKPYKIVNEFRVQAATVDWRAIRALLDPPPEFTQPFRPAHENNGQPRPGDQWAAATSWDDILKPRGWRKVRDFGNGHACWCRPGKEGRFTSATTRDNGGLYVFSTSTEFEPEKPYSKFGALALLEHGGDHTAAAKALRTAGYGTTAPMLTAAAAPSSNGHQPPDDLPDFDLGALAARGIKEPERIAHGMLYPGSVHCLAGIPGGGKTTLLAWWMLRHIRDGGNVMLLDEEAGPEQAAEKFLDLGATPNELRPPRFSYIPFPARDWNVTDLTQLHDRILARHPGIIGWDSVAAFLAIAGADENSAADVTMFWQRVLVPCARQFGAAVVGVDHTVKNGEHGGYGRGSGAKRAASDVQYILDTIKSFNRQQDGVLRLTTSPGKDRRGWLATAYEIHVRTGETITLEIGEASEPVRSGRIEMSPGKAKLWEALKTIGSEDAPVPQGELVDWVKHKYGHGLKRQTCSTYLNELSADGLADSISAKPGQPKYWYPLTVSPSPDASALTRQGASAPLTGADATDDTPDSSRTLTGGAP